MRCAMERKRILVTLESVELEFLLSWLVMLRSISIYFGFVEVLSIDELRSNTVPSISCDQSEQKGGRLGL